MPCRYQAQAATPFTVNAWNESAGPEGRTPPCGNLWPLQGPRCCLARDLQRRSVGGRCGQLQTLQMQRPTTQLKSWLRSIPSGRLRHDLLLTPQRLAGRTCRDVKQPLESGLGEDLGYLRSSCSDRRNPPVRREKRSPKILYTSVSSDLRTKPSTYW